jgi:hypothetical protein
MDPIGETKQNEINGRQWLVVIILDILILSEVALSVYLAAANPDDFTLIFMKRFFSMAIPTLVSGMIVKRFFRSAPQIIVS